MVLKTRSLTSGAPTPLASADKLQGLTSGGSYALIDASEVASSLNNVVTINTIADFSTPTDLADGLGNGHREGDFFMYLGNHITFTNPIIPNVGDSETLNIYGLNSRRLIYNGTGAFFRANATSATSILEIQKVDIVGDTTNELFDFANAESLLLDGCVLEDFANLGTLDSLEVFEIQSSIVQNNKESLTLNDVGVSYFKGVVFDDSGLAPELPSKNQVEITGTSFTNVFSDMQMLPRAGDYAFYIPNDAVGRFIFSNIDFINDLGGAAFNPSGLDQTDPRVVVQNCTGIENSKFMIDQHVGVPEGSAPTTVLTIFNQPVPINNTFQYAMQERFSGATDGRMTYLGLERHVAVIHGTATVVQSTNGTNESYSIFPSIGNLTTRLVLSVADAGGGNVNIEFNNPHNLQVGDRFRLTDMTDPSYNYTYTVDTIVNSTTCTVAATYTTTATGGWWKLCEDQRKIFELDYNSPQSISFTGTVENLNTEDVIFWLVEATVGNVPDDLKFFNWKVVLN